MRRFTLCLLSLLPLFAGCRGYDPLGQWYGPYSPTELQQHQVQVVDPYPSPDVGPEVVGGRPRGFQVPRAQMQQILTGPRNSYGQPTLGDPERLDRFKW